MSTATDMLTKYLDAEEAILQGKEVRIGDRTFRYEDLAVVQQGRREWEARARAEARSGANTIGGLGFCVARMD